MFECEKIKAGSYYLKFNGVIYALITRCSDDMWRYDDNRHFCYMCSKKDCIDHFKLHNWSNTEKYKPLPSFLLRLK